MGAVRGWGQRGCRRTCSSCWSRGSELGLESMCSGGKSWRRGTRGRPSLVVPSLLPFLVPLRKPTARLVLGLVLMEMLGLGLGLGLILMGLILVVMLGLGLGLGLPLGGRRAVNRQIPRTFGWRANQPLYLGGEIGEQRQIASGFGIPGMHSLGLPRSVRPKGHTDSRAQACVCVRGV